MSGQTCSAPTTSTNSGTTSTAFASTSALTYIMADMVDLTSNIIDRRNRTGKQQPLKRSPR